MQCHYLKLNGYVGCLTLAACEQKKDLVVVASQLGCETLAFHGSLAVVGVVSAAVHLINSVGVLVLADLSDATLLCRSGKA